MSIRVAVLAPSPLVRAGIDALLAEVPGLVLVSLPVEDGGGGTGDGGDGASPLERAAGSGADVIVWAPASSRDVAATLGAGLLDLGSGVFGDEPVSSFAALVVIADLAPRDVIAALRAGTRAVLPNGVRADTLGATVVAAAAGLVVLPAVDAARLLPGEGDGTGREERGGAPDPAVAANVAPLSGRERDVLGLMAEGLANKQIAFRLGISEHTVKTHVAALFGKLHAGTRAEAVVTAARAGLLLL